MKRFFYLLFLVPLAVLLILLSVANRQVTVFSLDPMNQTAPALSFEMPLFVFLFIAVMLGMIIGSFLTWFSQGRYRRALREKSYEANQLKQENASTETKEVAEQKQEFAPGLPMISS